MQPQGRLYIVATPIGYLQDITLHALDVLKTVNRIYAEDTRHSQRLLEHFNIQTPLYSLHDHNEKQRVTEVVARLTQGESLALISDAGTPLISDPGYTVVRQVQQEGFRVVPIPGACAAITALCASGLATDRFVFEGFLPAKTVGRQHRLQALLYEPRTLIFYESCHRIKDTLQDFVAVFGTDRPLVLARELTKTFETIYPGTCASVLQWLQADANQEKGEFVLLLGGYEAAPDEITPEAMKLLTQLVAVLPLKTAAQITSEMTGLKKNFLYDYAVSKGMKKAD